MGIKIKRNKMEEEREGSEAPEATNLKRSSVHLKSSKKSHTGFLSRTYRKQQRRDVDYKCCMAEVNDVYFGEEMEGKILSFQKSQPPGTVSVGVGGEKSGGKKKKLEKISKSLPGALRQMYTQSGGGKQKKTKIEEGRNKPEDCSGE